MVDRVIRIRIDPSDANRGIRQIDGNMQQLGGTTDRLQTQLTRVAQAVAAAFSVRQIVAYADEFTNIQNRIRVVTNTTAELTQKTAELLQIANDTRSTYESTAVLFSRLAQSTTELGVSQERLLAITETINKSFAVSGATTQEASNAIRQLSQGFASGALRGEEFNSVAEQAPEILRAVAKETGLAYGELREFAATGGITSEILIRAIENYADTVDESFAKTNRTFEQSATIARNNAIAFVGGSELVQKATSGIGDALVNLSNNLDAVAASIGVLIVGALGKYAVAAGVAAASNIALTKTTINQTLAERAQAQAAFFAANGVRVKTVAVQRATVQQIAYTTALNAGRAALSLLAGPLGAIILAATAYLVYSSNSEKARAETEKLNEEVDILVANFKTLNQQGQSLTFQKLTDEQIRLNRELQAATAEYDRLKIAADNATRSSTGGFGDASAIGRLSKAAGAVGEINKQLEDLSVKQQKLFEVGLPTEDSLFNPDAAGKVSKSTDELALKLGDLAAKVSLSSIEYSVFAERQRLVKEGFSTAEIEAYIGSFRQLLQLQQAPQDEQTAARINSRIEGIRLETQTISSELELQRQVRLGFITQEQADLDFQTQQQVDKLVTERELILAEKALTDEQRLAAETAFQEQLTAIDEQYAERRIEVERLEKNTRIGLTQDFANAAVGIIAAFGSKSFQAQKNAAIATGIINIAGGVAKALNNPYPANLGFAAQVAAQGAGLISTIKSTNIGSGGGGFSGVSGAAQSLPTIPEAAPQVGSFEIAGLADLQQQLNDLDNDEVLPVAFTKRLVASLNSVQRLEGGG